MTIRIIVADDHPMIIKGLQNMLAFYPHIVMTASYNDGASLLQGLEKELPDVLLLDIQLPDRTGDELVPVLLKKYPELKILMLTNFNSTLYISNVLRHGALGYLLKTTDEDTLITAIETVCRGEQFLESDIRKKLDLSGARRKQELRTKSSLTLREKEILRLIINGHTGQEIAEKLHIGFRTVENYRFNILLKLDVKNTAALVKKALTLGLAD